MYDRTAERFWSKVDFLNPSGCWLWTASLRKKDRYGQFRGPNGIVKAHRFAYALMVGPPPDGLVLDHLCRNRHCVRPDHLEPVTVGENTRRGDAAEVNRARHAARTHCKQGHELTVENTSVSARGRRCRTCVRAWSRKYRQQKVAA